MNGVHVKYVVPEKTKRGPEAGTGFDACDGFCKPARFDVTDVVRSGDNQITILADRYKLNELGTGGLMGPVMLYRDK